MAPIYFPAFFVALFIILSCQRKPQQINTTFFIWTQQLFIINGTKIRIYCQLFGIVLNSARELKKKKHNISIILALFVYFSGAETYFMYSVDLACDFNDISILGGRRATQLGQIELQLINTTSDRKLEAIYLSEVHFSLILLHMPPLYMECKTYHRVMKINQLKGRPCVQDQKKSILQTMIESSKEAFYSIAEI